MTHLWRGLVGTTGMALTFIALGLLPLPEITAILYASPLLVVVLAAMFLGEQVRAFRLGAVGLGLVGVLIVLSPRLSPMGAAQDLRHTLGATVALGSALLGALAHVFVRNMVRSESVSSIVFYFSLTATLLSLLTIPWGWAMPSPTGLVLLVSAGLLGGMGQIFMTAAYRHADASVVAPFEYFSMLLALTFGYFFFHEVPTLTTLAGAALVILAGVLIIWRERQLGLDRARPRSARTPDA
jgi:drug/metabolite transporter (DMT)-like permease